MAVDAVFPAASELVMLYGGALASGALTHELDVFGSRLTPVVRSFVSIPAGVFEARLPRYTVLTAVGSAIWCFAFAGAGWGLGASWSGVHHGFRYVDYAVVAGILLLAAYLLVR